MSTPKQHTPSREELGRLLQEANLLHADELPTKAGIEQIHAREFADFLEKAHMESFPDTDAERSTLFENMNLFCNNRLNLAGLLLFGKNPQIHKPQFVVKAVSFAGNNIMDSYLESDDFEGPIPVMFQKALSFIMRNLRKLQGKKGVNTIGDPEIPQVVFEELLVNALIHRDYFINAPIRIFIFDNRIEICSPGHLPNHLTVEKICAGTSVQRNPTLTTFIAKGLLPYRGLGTGVRRALQEWPEIEFINDEEGCPFTSIVKRPA